MELTGYVVKAVTVEGRPVVEVAAAHGVSRSWMYELLARYRVGATRRCSPARNARTVHRPRSGAAVEDEIVALRKQLSEQGLDAGAHTIQFHLMRRRRHRAVPSVATIWRVLRRHGFVTPNPRSDRAAPTTGCKPTCPNELWQADTEPTGVSPRGAPGPEAPSVDGHPPSGGPRSSWRHRRCHRRRRCHPPRRRDHHVRRRPHPSHCRRRPSEAAGRDRLSPYLPARDDPSSTTASKRRTSWRIPHPLRATPEFIRDVVPTEEHGDYVNPIERLSRMHMGENDIVTGFSFPLAWAALRW